MQAFGKSTGGFDGKSVARYLSYELSLLVG